MSTLLDQFLEEGPELLDAATSGLLELERRPGDAELVNAVFRAAHTFKGSSALFEFELLTQVVHAAEDVLDAVRQGTLGLTGELVDALMEALDLARAWLGAIEADGALPADAAGVGAARIAALRGTLDGGAVVVDVAADAAAPAADAPEWARRAVEAAAAGVVGALETLVAVRYTPDAGAFFRGEDPLATVREVPGLASLVIERADEGDWPSIDDVDEYEAALRFTLVADATDDELEPVFRYVPDEVELYRVAVGSEAADEHDAVRAAIVQAQRAALAAPCPPEQEEARVASVANSLRWVAGEADALAAPTRDGLLALLDRLGTPAPDAAPEPTADAAPAAPAASDEPATASPAAPSSRTIKVDQAKVDRLLELVGELVVAKNALPFLARQAEEADDPSVVARSLKDHHAVTNRLVEELQEAAMDMRMLPVSMVFGRFPRLVRDIARKLGKQVRLVTEGEDTAADKDVLELLADPMIHLVRNSLDHGFGTVEERLAVGKPAEGTLTLRATQEADSVLIEIVDDGKGIDPEKMRQVAYAKGVIGERELETLSDAEALNLIFAPGFSTAETISDLSGRGVGMDAVRTVIERLGGAISVDSVLGQGTTVRLKLPLSMAVSQVMLVTVAGQRFGVPVDLVRETVRLERSEIQAVGHQPAIERRGSVVPVVDLAELLDLEPTPRTGDEEDDDVRVLVVRPYGTEIALVVDRFDENLDVISKPLEGILAGHPGLSGTALLGDGQVLLVLNLKELLGHGA